MQENSSLAIILRPRNGNPQSVSWGKAYVKFLLSRDENLLLKIAPLALAGLLPVDIISNVVPFVGELDDIGFIIALLIVAGRTLHSVNKYR